MPLQPPAYTGSHAGARSRVRQKSCLPEPSEAIAKRCLYQLLQLHKEGADGELRAGYSSTSHLMRVSAGLANCHHGSWLCTATSSHYSADPIQTIVCVQRWQVY